MLSAFDEASEASETTCILSALAAFFHYSVKISHTYLVFTLSSSELHVSIRAPCPQDIANDEYLVASDEGYTPAEISAHMHTPLSHGLYCKILVQK